MIGNYLVHRAMWQKSRGTSGRGQPILDLGVEIDCRWEGKVRTITKADGTSVLTEARVFTQANVSPGDVLIYRDKSREVHAAAEMPSLDGETLFYEVWV